MEIKVGNLLFTSKFDSGNLAQVEKVLKDDDESAGNYTVVPGLELKTDYEYNVWTKPDCAGTQHENGNRSWFYFGIRGWAPNKVIKINIMNLNRQGKLYSQGHSPFTRTLPGKPKWERIRDKPSFEVVDGQFILSFTYRFPEYKGATTYFAFCFPWSYTESQNQMSDLDKKFDHCKIFNSKTPPDSLYYHRELLCWSLDKLRVDLITISSCHGMTDENEPRFDKHLFPDKGSPRCRKFKGKKVYLLSSRVHPGETPGSFVFNGLLEFILRENDPRAQQLRRQYVFKLIPLLNPDGVMRGHYRTDPRGVNLNRVYLDPSPTLHPSIYAAKSLLVFHHVHNRTIREGHSKEITVDFPTDEIRKDESPLSSSRTLQGECISDVESITPTNKDNNANALIVHSPHCFSSTTPAENRQTSNGDAVPSPTYHIEKLDLAGLDGNDTPVSESSLFPESLLKPISRVSSSCTSVLSNFDALKGESRNLNSELRLQLSELTMSEDFRGDSAFNDKLSDSDLNNDSDHLGNEGSDDNDDVVPSSTINAPHLCLPKLLSISPGDSGIAFYVDLHGHASKRGAFIYGNFLENEDMQVENMLFPKLVSLNTAHFDFTGCNFSERNMYTKDKRDGMSKEGSGRVSTLKAIGIIHSYTLECNYNTGRMVNPVPPAQNDDGRATPPPLAGFPPKYTQSHFEDIGKALAIAALDMTNSNPWSRIGSSENSSLQGVRDSVRRYLRSLRGGPRQGKNSFTKQTSRIGNNSSYNQNNNRQLKGNQNEYSSYGTRFNSTSRPGRRLSTDNTSSGNNPIRRLSTDSQANAQYNASTQNVSRKELAPVKESTRSGNYERTQMNLPACSGKLSSTTSAPVCLVMTKGQQNDSKYFRHSSADTNVRKNSGKTDATKNNSLLSIANKKQGPPTKLPMPSNSAGLDFQNPSHVDYSSSCRLTSTINNQRRNGSGSRRTLEDAIFHNDSNLLTARSTAPSSGHSGRRVAQNSGNSLHRVAVTSALSSASSTNRMNSGQRPPVSSGNTVNGQLPIPATDDGLHIGDSPKPRRKISYLKKKCGSQSPKIHSYENVNGNYVNDTDHKPRRRRRKSQHRLSFLSPSHDDMIKQADICVPTSTMSGNAVNFTPRHIINSFNLPSSNLFLPENPSQTVKNHQKIMQAPDKLDFQMWKRTKPTKHSLFWVNF